MFYYLCIIVCFMYYLCIIVCFAHIFAYYSVRSNFLSTVLVLSEAIAVCLVAGMECCINAHGRYFQKR